MLLFCLLPKVVTHRFPGLLSVVVASKAGLDQASKALKEINKDAGKSKYVKEKLKEWDVISKEITAGFNASVVKTEHPTEDQITPGKLDEIQSLFSNISDTLRAKAYSPMVLRAIAGYLAHAHVKGSYTAIVPNYLVKLTDIVDVLSDAPVDFATQFNRLHKELVAAHVGTSNAALESILTPSLAPLPADMMNSISQLTTTRLHFSHFIQPTIKVMHDIVQVDTCIVNAPFFPGVLAQGPTSRKNEEKKNLEKEVNVLASTLASAVPATASPSIGDLDAKVSARNQARAEYASLVNKKLAALVAYQEVAGQWLPSVQSTQGSSVPRLPPATAPATVSFNGDAAAAAAALNWDDVSDEEGENVHMDEEDYSLKEDAAPVAESEDAAVAEPPAAAEGTEEKKATKGGKTHADLKAGVAIKQLQNKESLLVEDVFTILRSIDPLISDLALQIADTQAKALAYEVAAKKEKATLRKLLKWLYPVQKAADSSSQFQRLQLKEVMDSASGKNHKSVQAMEECKNALESSAYLARNLEEYQKLKSELAKVEQDFARWEEQCIDEEYAYNKIKLSAERSTVSQDEATAAFKKLQDLKSKKESYAMTIERLKDALSALTFDGFPETKVLISRSPLWKDTIQAAAATRFVFVLFFSVFFLSLLSLLFLFFVRCCWAMMRIQIKHHLSIERIAHETKRSNFL